MSENNAETQETLVITLHESMDAVIGQAVTQLKNTTVTDEKLAELKRDYSQATIAGVNDKDGYKFVSEGLSTIKRTVTEIGKIRKELTEPALKFQRNLIAEEKRIVAELEPLVKHLSGEKSKIDAEKERLKKEKELRFLERTNRLFSEGVKFDGFAYSVNGGELGELVISLELIQDGTGEDFEAKIAEVKAFQSKINEAAEKKAAEVAEAARVAAENARIEAEKQAAKDKEIEALRAKLAALEKPAEIVPAQSAPAENEPVQNTVQAQQPEQTQQPAAKPNWAQSSRPAFTPQPNSATPNTPAMKSKEYMDGYHKCQQDVIVAMSDASKQLNRAGWIEVFRNLKP